VTSNANANVRIELGHSKALLKCQRINSLEEVLRRQVAMSVLLSDIRNPYHQAVWCTNLLEVSYTLSRRQVGLVPRVDSDASSF
jgi:hypothetical protein